MDFVFRGRQKMGANGASRSFYWCKTQSATTAAERVPSSPAERPRFQLRRSIDCCHAPPAAWLGESWASRLHSISLLHPPGAQTRALLIQPPLQNQTPLSPRPLAGCLLGLLLQRWDRVPCKSPRARDQNKCSLWQRARRKRAKGREKHTDRKHTSEGAHHDYSFRLKKTRGHWYFRTELCPAPVKHQHGQVSLQLRSSEVNSRLLSTVSRR